MGTRALVHVKDGGTTLVTIYRQYDGYPTGLGEELVEFLRDRQVVNGFGEYSPKVSNGMGCLAASLVASLKHETGNVYIYPADSTHCGEEYVYTIRHGGLGTLRLTIAEGRGGRKLYDGPAANLTPAILATL